MATRRTRRGISAASDPILKMLQTLVEQEHIEIQSQHLGFISAKVKEHIRYLDIKVPPKVSIYDNETARKAVAMENVLRQGIDVNGTIVRQLLSFKVFESETAMKAENIEKLAGAINMTLESRSGITANAGTNNNRAAGSARMLRAMQKKGIKVKEAVSSKPKAHIENNKVTGKPSSKLQEHLKILKSKAKSGKRTRSNVQEEVSKELNLVRPVHMHEIAMKMQSKLHDPNACEKSATSLFIQLSKWLLQDPHKRRSARQDIEKYLKYYETSCFLIAANEMDKGKGSVSFIDLSTMGKSSKLSLRKKQSVNKNHKDPAMSDSDSENDEENTLCINDIADYLNQRPSEFESFVKTIIPQVKDLRASQKDKEIKQRQQVKEKVNTHSAKSKRRKKSFANSKHDIMEDILQIDSLKEEESVPSNPVKEQKNVSYTPHNCETNFHDFPSFHKWKLSRLQPFFEKGTSMDNSESFENHCMEIIEKYSKY